MKRRPFIVLVTLISVIILVEMIVRIAPVHFYSEPIDYILLTSGEKIRSGGNDHRTILFGDSRSMALKTPYPGASFYNYSVPYIGNRYYSTVYNTYISKNRTPDTVIMAMHPHLLLIPMERPVSSPGYKEESGAAAIGELLLSRLSEPLFQKFRSPEAEPLNPFENYRNRTLLFTGYTDSIAMYSGMDRLMQAYEAMPALYRTFFLRSSISTFISSKGGHDSQKCFECSDIYEARCTDRLTTRDRTRIIQKLVADGGSFNLDNLMTSKSRIPLLLLRDSAIKGMAASYSDSDAAIDTMSLERFVAAVTRSGARFIYLELPLPEPVAGSPNVVRFRNAIKNVLMQHQNTGYVSFPTITYPVDRYIDPLHLSCEGAMHLNEDWRKAYKKLLAEDNP